MLTGRLSLKSLRQARKCASEGFVPSNPCFLAGSKAEQWSSPGFDSRIEINPGSKMTSELSRQSHRTRRGGTPLAVAIAIAVVGVLGMLVVDHGPWNKPHAKTAVVANMTTTGDAARNAGATVIPTEPKRLLEPEAPGPRPVHPVNPALPPENF